MVLLQKIGVSSKVASV